MYIHIHMYKSASKEKCANIPHNQIWTKVPKEQNYSAFQPSSFNFPVTLSPHLTAMMKWLCFQKEKGWKRP